MMTKRVLLIDDDKDDAAILLAAFSESGLSAALDHFENGSLALDTLMNNKGGIPDVIFLDINMPVINGWECLREIKKLAELQSIPIVMYSTFNLKSEGISAKDVGATAFFTKPDKFSELKSKLLSLFDELFTAGTPD